MVLVEVLREWLKRNNTIRDKGQRVAFSESNITPAIEQLTNEPYDGLIRTNEKLYELLRLGTTLTQTIAGDSKSYWLRYIDWLYAEKNLYHVTDEYSVERRYSQQTRRPDMVCFVNVVIECKRPDKSRGGESAVWEGLSQMLRNQKEDEIP